MVGGDAACYERCADLLCVLGKTVVYMGDIGKGMQIKLINNMISACNQYVAAECLVLAKKLGLDLRLVYEVVKNGSGDSFVFHQKLPYFWLKGNFEPGFPLDGAYKDISLGTEMAREACVPLRIPNLVQEAMVQAKARGFGSKDSTAFLVPLEEAVGVEVRLDVS